MLLMVRAMFPVLLRVAVFVALLFPTPTLPKERLPGLRLATAPVPVPSKAIVGLPASVETVTVPDVAPMACGANVTLMVHEPPPRATVLQSLVVLKSPLLSETELTLRSTSPLFVSVAESLDDEPTAIDPKLIEVLLRSAVAAADAGTTKAATA